MYSCALIASNNSHYFQVLRVHTKQLYRRSCHLKLDSLICIHCTKTNMPKGKFKLCTLQCCGVCVMWGDDKVSPPPPPRCGSLLARCRGLPPLPPPRWRPGFVSAPTSLGSWHSCPDLCQIPEKRQMGLAFYVLIKEEFAPSQTRHLWPMCLVTFIIHPQRGEPL